LIGQRQHVSNCASRDSSVGPCINVLEGLSYQDIPKHFLTTRGLFLRYGLEDSIILGVIGT